MINIANVLLIRCDGCNAKVKYTKCIHRYHVDTRLPRLPWIYQNDRDNHGNVFSDVLLALIRFIKPFQILAIHLKHL